METDLEDDFFNIDHILEDEIISEYLLYVQEIDSNEECNCQSENEEEPTSNAMEIEETNAETYEETNATTTTATINQLREKRELTTVEKRKILDKLLSISKDDKLPKGSISETAAENGLHRTTVSRLWNKALKDKQMGVAINVQLRKKGNVGCKMKTYSEEWLQSVPLHKRTTVRSFAGALRVSPSLIYRLLKRGFLRSHTSSNHPGITEEHKLKRMKWVLQHIQPGTSTKPAVFESMQNVIHIDEKWFYLNLDMRRFYLLPREDDPYRAQVSKRYKIKAMFMGVTFRPIFDCEGNMVHDGKFGIFPFVKKVAAKKTSKNRVRGTLETKAIEKINQKVIRDMLIQQIIPCIMAKWPEGVSKEIYIQQDNARPHIQPDDPAFKEAATQNGFNIQLLYQPPQSPDLNVLDLGFFRAIQALQYQSFPKNLDDLVEKVQDAYDFFDPEVLKYTWLQLQWVMVEILKCKGGNGYKNPHHGKARLERQGMLPANVEVDQAVVDEAVRYLDEQSATVIDVQDYMDEEEIDTD